MSSSRHGRALLACLVALGVAFYAFNVAHYVKQPLRIEEGDFPPMGRAVYTHGIPEIRFGEDHRIQLLPDLSVDRSDVIGLWHPPVYMYSMAGLMTVVGPDATMSLRLIGVLGLLLSCALLFVISRELFAARWFEVGSVAALVLLVHPYAIQGSMFLDIDTSIYAPTFLLFTALLLRFDGDKLLTASQALALAASFALILWVKLPTALVVVPVAALFWVLRVGVFRGLAQAGAVFAGGAALFLGTYAIYVWVTGQSFWYMFDFTVVKKGGPRFLEGSHSTIKSAIDWHVAWITPALLLVTAAYGIVALRRWVRTRTAHGLDFVWALGLAILIAYVFVIPNGTVYQGKYAFPALPLLVFAAAAFLLGEVRNRPDAGSLGLAVLVAIVAAYVMPDLLTDQHFTVLAAEAKLATIAGTGAALWIAVRGVGRAGLIPVGALVVCFGLFLAQSIRSYRADTSPLYPASDTKAFEASADYINRHLGANEIAIVSKDLGVRIDGTVIDGEGIWLVRGDEFEARAIRRLREITMIGTNTFGPPLGPETLQIIDRCFEERSFGRASVFVRRAECGGHT